MSVEILLILALATVPVLILAWLLAAIVSFERAKRNFVDGPPLELRPLPERRLGFVAEVNGGHHKELNGGHHNLVRDKEAADAVLREVNWDFPLAVPPRVETGEE